MTAEIKSFSLRGMIKEINVRNGDCTMGEVLDALGHEKVMRLLKEWKLDYDDMYEIYCCCGRVVGEFYTCYGLTEVELTDIRRQAYSQCQTILEKNFESAECFVDFLVVQDFDRLLSSNISPGARMEKVLGVIERDTEWIEEALDAFQKEGNLESGSAAMKCHLEKLSLRHKDIGGFYRNLVDLYKKMKELEGKIWPQGNASEYGERKNTLKEAKNFQDQLCRCARMSKGVDESVISTVEDAIFAFEIEPEELVRMATSDRELLESLEGEQNPNNLVWARTDAHFPSTKEELAERRFALFKAMVDGAKTVGELDALYKYEMYFHEPVTHLIYAKKARLLLKDSGLI